MAVNTFFASLLGSWVGLPVLSTAASIWLGAMIAVPLTWLFAQHIRGLMDAADMTPTGESEVRRDSD